MAIAEFTNQIIFNTTDEQAEFLKTVPNKSEFIREAIQQKIEQLKKDEK